MSPASLRPTSDFSSDNRLLRAVQRPGDTPSDRVRGGTASDAAAPPRPAPCPRTASLTRCRSDIAQPASAEGECAERVVNLDQEPAVAGVVELVRAASAHGGRGADRSPWADSGSTGSPVGTPRTSPRGEPPAAERRLELVWRKRRGSAGDDRAAGQSQQSGHHRSGLPPTAPAGHHEVHRSDVRDLRWRPGTGRRKGKRRLLINFVWPPVWSLEHDRGPIAIMRLAL